MKIKVDIDVAGVLQAVGKIPRALSREVKPEMKIQLRDVQKQARRNHRFDTRSGAAERSIQTEISRSGFSGKVYLDLGIAAYARRLHKGWGTWRPDRFLNKAGKRLKPKIMTALQDAVKRGIRKAGF